MRILLSWQLVVAPILFLASFAFSESQLSDSLTDSTSTETREDNPVPIKISSLQHESVLIKIYDSQTTSNNKKIYFYSPIALLNQLSGISGNQKDQGSLSISFSIWSKVINNKVAQHLTQILNQQIEHSQVQVFPFDSVRLTSTVQSADFSLTNEWLPYKKQPTVRFSVTCPTQDDCERMKNQMHINPKQFEHLRLEFSPQLNYDADSIETNPELLVNIEAKLAKGLSALREEIKKDFAASSQILENRIIVTEENLLVALNNLEMTRKELTQTNRILEEVSAELNGTKREMVKTRDDFSKTADDFTERLIVKETELDEMKLTTDNLTTELLEAVSRLETETTNSASTRTELDSTKSAITDLTSKLNVVEKKLEATEMALDSTRIELNSTNFTVNDLSTNLNARTREIVDIGKMPTSCGDLQKMGQKISGIFLVKGLMKMEMVYCDFYPNQNDLQKWIGYADVKSAPVHFYVQRSSQFFPTGTPITFDRVWVNEGNAMNVTSGIFTAPKAGTYFFSFTGLASYPANNGTSWLDVTLYLNGHSIGKAWVHESDVTFHHNNPVTLQVTLHLNHDDKISLEIAGKSENAFLHDDDRHFTHFTGFMLEEEVSVSL